MTYDMDRLEDQNIGECFDYENNLYIIIGEDTCEMICQDTRGRKIHLDKKLGVAIMPGELFLEEEAKADRIKETPIVNIDEPFTIQHMLEGGTELRARVVVVTVENHPHTFDELPKIEQLTLTCNILPLES